MLGYAIRAEQVIQNESDQNYGTIKLSQASVMNQAKIMPPLRLGKQLFAGKTIAYITNAGVRGICTKILSRNHC